MSHFDREAEIASVVQRIPRGSVASYGCVGRHLTPPLSGFLVGRVIQVAEARMRWWRVVGASGTFPVNKLDPRLACEQEVRLREEGVAMAEPGRVSPEASVESIPSE